MTTFGSRRHTPACLIEIPLSEGKIALIEDEDLHLVEGHKWYAVNKGKSGSEKWYAACRMGGETVWMHRYLLGLQKGDPQIGDHQFGNSLDNRQYNLRITDKRGDATTRQKRVRSKSGFKGVSWDASSSKWRATLTRGGNIMQLGMYKTPEDAARAFDKAVLKWDGPGTFLNFPL